MALADLVGLSGCSRSRLAPRKGMAGYRGHPAAAARGFRRRRGIENQALIQDYFTRVRSAHRYIGRVLNEAVGETVLHARGQDSIRKLETTGWP